jgi:hypothetical protein
MLHYWYCAFVCTKFCLWRVRFAFSPVAINRASSSIAIRRHYAPCYVYQFCVLCKISLCCQKKTVASLTVNVWRFCKVFERVDAAASVLKISYLRYICTSASLDYSASPLRCSWPECPPRALLYTTTAITFHSDHFALR